MSDPLARALTALEALHAPRTDPVSAAFLEEARDGLLEAQRERAALVELVRASRELIDALDQLEAPVDANTARLLQLGEAAEAAEAAFVEALNCITVDLDAEDLPARTRLS